MFYKIKLKKKNEIIILITYLLYNTIQTADTYLFFLFVKIVDDYSDEKI